jgi:hypothetical protein
MDGTYGRIRVGAVEFSARLSGVAAETLRTARVEAKWKGPVLTVDGETVHRRILAKRALGAGKHLPGPMCEIEVQARTKAGK